MAIDTLRRSRPLLAGHGREVEHGTVSGSVRPTPETDRSTTERGAAADRGASAHGRWPTAAFDHARMEAAGCLTAGLAHGFNNMLAALLGGLDLAIDALADRPDVRRNLELAVHIGQQGTRMIGHLRSFSRQQVLRPVAVDLPRVLGELSRVLGRSFGRDIWVRVEASPSLPAVFTDAAHLEAAILNLALNAREAMPDGGELWIEAYTEGDRVAVAVSDNGAGMPPVVLARACEPFFTTKDTAGAGLGLSMVYGFVYQSGGRLEIRSNLGAGTRVELLLPVAPSTVSIAARPAHERANGRVLVVDDQPEVRRITAEFLRNAGFEVAEASGGVDALDGAMLSGPAFDVLVADYAMPGMDGVELVLQARELRPALPALVITGHAGPRGYGSGSGAGMRLEDLPADVEVLHKPFPKAELVRRVKLLAGGAGGAPPVEAARVTTAERA